MKKLLVIVMFLFFAGQAWGQDPLFYHWDGQYIRDSQSGVTPWNGERDSHTDLLIRKWAASGEICRVLGHRWGNYKNDWGNEITYNPYRKPKKQTRECEVCGKVETLIEEWR